MRVSPYAPRDENDQTPHAHDERYFIAGGNRWFVRSVERIPFEQQDVLFVPDGMLRRFEDFKPIFATWAGFWGAVGCKVGSWGSAIR
jgi:hypothetical protein